MTLVSSAYPRRDALTRCDERDESNVNSSTMGPRPRGTPSTVNSASTGLAEICTTFDCAQPPAAIAIRIPAKRYEIALMFSVRSCRIGSYTSARAKCEIPPRRTADLLHRDDDRDRGFGHAIHLLIDDRHFHQ